MAAERQRVRHGTISCAKRCHSPSTVRCQTCVQFPVETILSVAGSPGHHQSLALSALASRPSPFDPFGCGHAYCLFEFRETDARDSRTQEHRNDDKHTTRLEFPHDADARKRDEPLAGGHLFQSAHSHSDQAFRSTTSIHLSYT